MQLFTASSILTLVCYAWLALPPSWTKSPMLGIVSFASGHGFSPCKCLLRSRSDALLTMMLVLLVVIVPRLVPAKYVSTTLGAHKAVSSVDDVSEYIC